MAQKVDTFDSKEDYLSESQMTLMEHLIELRYRLMWVVAALAVGTIIGFFITVTTFPGTDFNLLAFIVSPLAEYDAKLQALGPTDTIFIAFKISFTAGTVLAIPVIVMQIIGFIAPGLYPNEKRLLYLLLPAMLLLFVIGAAFAFFVMLPVAVGFLQTFLGEVIEQQWAVDRYIGVVNRIVFWLGVAFEMPLVVSFLARIGLVSGPGLLRVWRQAIVVISIVAALITPTIDPINMSIVMAPLLVLYALSVGLAYLIYKPREPRDFSD